MQALPLSLYIHLPWCIRKCPYCDFNSHVTPTSLFTEREAGYVKVLLADLAEQSLQVNGRSLTSLFFGGGTPSLFSGEAIAKLLAGIKACLPIQDNAEITLEANPGTLDQARFDHFHQAGITRLSLGVQSFQESKLKALGRIHNGETALKAIAGARHAGFTNLNIDLMYGLPDQTLAEATADLETALACQPAHVSWYQLTIEPNTPFYHCPPTLPTHDLLWEIQLAGQRLLSLAGLTQYEVSAYAPPISECRHNRNYWEFGDYLGIGAGAHSKLTDPHTKVVRRFAQMKHPRDYQQTEKRQQPAWSIVPEKDLIFEFMLNTQRLVTGVPIRLFTERTGLPLSSIEPTLQQAEALGFLHPITTHIRPTTLGRRYLNDLVALFL